MADDPFAGQSVRDLLRARHGPGGLEECYNGPIPGPVDDAWHRAWRLALARDRAAGPRSDPQRQSKVRESGTGKAPDNLWTA